VLKDYLGELANGRLTPVRFVVLWVVLVVAFLAVMLGMGAAIGITERIIGGDIATTQEVIRQKFGLPALIVLLILGVAFIFAHLNILAKRARDIGLPGWLVAILVAALLGASSQSATGIGGLIAVLLLAVLPTDMLARKA
jgi:uncharacterized membrane protein YhaH (DUF805 family)